MKWKVPVNYEMNGFLVVEGKDLDSAAKAEQYVREHLGEFDVPAAPEYKEGSMTIRENIPVEMIPDTLVLSDEVIDDIVDNFSNAVNDTLINGRVSEISYHLNNAYDIIASKDSELGSFFFISIKYVLNGNLICREIVYHDASDESYLYLRVKIRNILKSYCK